MSVVRASSKFQVAIPKSIRGKLNIKAGQCLSVSEVDGSILLTPIPENPIEFLCGILNDGPSATEELLKERKRDLRHE